MVRLAAFLVFATVWIGQIHAGGPTGLGSIKVGMSKTEIESLKPEDGILLSGPMTEYKYPKNVQQRPGRDKFDSSLVTPLSTTPLKSVLTFEDGKLVDLYVDLGESENIFHKIKAQISEKYGQPTVANSMKEEQCIYRNGNSFKISSGNISNQWQESQTPFGDIQTSLSDFQFKYCPTNLRYGMTDIRLLSLSIGVVRQRQEPKPKNLF